MHSQLAYTPVMRELEPEPLLKVNATDAAERGIQQGDYVRVYNDHGYAVLKARVTEGIKRESSLFRTVSRLASSSRGIRRI